MEAIHDSGPVEGDDPIYMRSVVFDEEWSHDDEEILKGSFNSLDERSIEATDASETALWRLCFGLFEMAPPDIILDGIALDHSKNASISHEGREFTNPNWTSGVCKILNKLLKTPAFKDNYFLLRHAIKSAMAIRLGREKPEKEEVFDGMVAKIMAVCEKGGMPSGQDDIREQIKTLVKGGGPPKYSRVIDHIALLPRTKKPPADDFLTKYDLEVIGAAWNTFVVTNPGLNLVHLDKCTVTIAKFWRGKAPTNVEKKKQSDKLRIEVLHHKKMYMLHQRRLAMQNGGWRRGDGFAEAVLIGDEGLLPLFVARGGLDIDEDYGYYPRSESKSSRMHVTNTDYGC